MTETSDTESNPSDSARDTEDGHGSIFDGLLGADASHWAFGTDFEDPLAGVDTSFPADVSGPDLAVYCLFLADDALIYSHRLSELCSHAPDVEEDIALANISLDLLGQARLLLARAAAADAEAIPCLPDGSPVSPEDALAFFREAGDFRNVRLVETPNGDFAETIVRLLLFSTARMAVFAGLRSSRDTVLSAIAVKAVKELTYHRDYAAQWFVTLAHGTQESRQRLTAALTVTWALYPELLEPHLVEQRLAEVGVAVVPSEVADEVDVVVDQVLAAGGIERPTVAALAGVRGRTGRDGIHTEALSHLLAEMQVVARAHPRGRW